MTHLDLFSGIGGFAYAADIVFGDIEHVFCEVDPFCQQVLKKHWPESEIYADIRQFKPSESATFDILTGGFPCQPFSAAGLRRGTDDKRHLWPEMLRVIQLTKPTWVIAENVYGLLTWDAGLQFEQVCLDLEANGYGVQAFIIPAVAVNAPHRRDRIWFVANAFDSRSGRTKQRGLGKPQKLPKEHRQEDSAARQSERADRYRRFNTLDWEKNWPQVAAELCSVDDGLSAELDGFKLSKSQHRSQQLKAYGNAIVPQVAMEIMRAMV